MEKEKNNTLSGIVGNIQEISKALDVLTANDVMSYIYLLIAEKSFSPATSKVLEIKDASEFLKGAHSALHILGDLPEMLAQVAGKKSNN